MAGVFRPHSGAPAAAAHALTVVSSEGRPGWLRAAANSVHDMVVLQEERLRTSDLLGYAVWLLLAIAGVGIVWHALRRPVLQKPTRETTLKWQ